jgi:hypothetical protein
MHVGYRFDSSNSVSGRAPSGQAFLGLWDSFVTFDYMISALETLDGNNPSTVVLAGGSAGGFGSIMLYGLLRAMLGASSQGTQIITISDSGTPLSSGTSSDGVTWQSQGYLGLPGTPASTVSSLEEYWFDAWGSTWTNWYPSSNISNPLGRGHVAFEPLQTVMAYNWIGSLTPGAPGFGDQFAVIDGTSDWMYWAFTPLVMNTTGGHPDIADAQNQLLTVLPTSVFFQISSTQVPFSILPWYQHHVFVGDDASLWGSTGLSQFLSTLSL